MLDGAMEPDLVLNFKETPWEEVLKWISKEAQLSMVTSEYPQGPSPTPILIDAIRWLKPWTL